MRNYSDTLRSVAPILAQLSYGCDILRTLADFERMTHDGGDWTSAAWCTAEAVYYVAGRWHGGQWCPWYAAGCATDFSPGMFWRRPERGTLEADATAALVRIVSSHERKRGS